MAQSVELLLDADAEAALAAQWALLADAGLPSEQRPGTNDHHRPHVTLYAGEALADEVEEILPALVANLDLEVRLGGLLIFGPRQGRFILVRQVTPSSQLLDVQRRVAEACGAGRDGQFGPGRWSPHVTLARRVPTERAGAMLDTLARSPDVAARITRCRRWDGTRKAAWLL